MGVFTASIVGIQDLDVYSTSPTLRGKLALDIRIQEGELHPSMSAWVFGPAGKSEVQIVGVEMFAPNSDPSIVRIHCLKSEALCRLLENSGPLTLEA